MAIFLDGFVIRPSEQLSILRAEDIVTIRYKSKKEEKKWKHEKKEKEKKRRTKKEAAPVVIDNSHNQPPSPGIAIPTNRIIRFDGENGSSSPSTTPLRIREEIAPTYTNTNTPTINARKKKKTRRGKRAGKQVSLKEMKPIAMEGDSVLSTKPEVSFLDYVVNAPPTVTANNTICSSFLETPESQMQSQKQEQSFVQLQQEQSSVHIQQEQSSAHIQQEQSSAHIQQEQPSTDYQQQQQPSMQLQQQQQQPYMPKVEDVIQFHTIVLNRELLSPEVKQVKGRVLSLERELRLMCRLNGSSVRVYLMQEDDIITVMKGKEIDT